MAIIKTETISQANIKTRWEEPYVSEAVNLGHGALPFGVYRGFELSEMSTPGSGITIKVEATAYGDDSFLVCRSAEKKFRCAVHFAADVTLTFSFTTGVDYYVWVELDYQVSSATAAYIKIGETADHVAALATGNAVTLGGFNSADSTITNADINASRLRPVPVADYNAFGLIDLTSYGYIPSSDQKAAMNAASSPTGANPFLTAADAPTNIPFTYVVSDGVRSTGGDFDGPTALVDAIEALNTAGRGGTIFVRIGEYTLTTQQWISRPMNIICEVPATNGSVGNRCALTMNHASSYGIVIESPSQIFGLKTIMGGASTQAFEMQEPTRLDKCDIDGSVDMSIGGLGAAFTACRFNDTLTLTTSDTVIEDCFWRIPGGGYCVVLNQVYRVRISRCEMDGCYQFGPVQDGGGITTAVGGTIDGLVLEDIKVYCAYTSHGVHLNSTGTVRGIKIKGLHVIEKWLLTGASSLQVGQSSNSVISVEDVRLERDHDQPNPANALAWLPGNNLVNAVARFSNIVMTGNDGYVTAGSTPNEGVVTFQANGLCEDVHLIVENLSMSGFLPSIAGPNFGILISAGIAWAKTGRHSTGITFERLNISNLNQAVMPSTGYMTGLSISNAGYYPGHVVIQNSTITGDGLDNSAGFAYWGVRVFEQGIDAPGQLVIRDSTITHWYTHDVMLYQCAVDLLIDGLASGGTANNLSGTGGARIWMDESDIKLRVVNCLWSGGGGNDYYLFVGTAGAATYYYPVVANNIINMGNAAKYAIYFQDGIVSGMIFANGGQSQISVLDADNFLGVGATTPADNNTNQMTVTLR